MGAEPHAQRLIAGEVALLHALADQRWRTRVELAENTGLVPAVAASMLRKLARRGLVRRNATWHSIGQWQITRLGLEQARLYASEASVP
jgi:DNA-binding IclR family transcriptional regulator